MRSDYNWEWTHKKSPTLISRPSSLILFSFFVLDGIIKMVDSPGMKLLTHLSRYSDLMFTFLNQIVLC